MSLALMRRALAAMVNRLPPKMTDPHELFPDKDTYEPGKKATVVWLPYSGERFRRDPW